MGLDMYAYVLEQQPAQAVDFPIPEGTFLLHYWRKHPDLHGWMEALYRSKGGKRKDFNCATVILDADDLDRLERDVRNATLPKTDGFFFGVSNGSERDDDLAFIAKARKAHASGLTVAYGSWW